jgi:hypothetical protein
MKNRMISIPEDLDVRLRLENNASKLIADLLYDHYRYDLSGTRDLSMAKRILEEEKQKINDVKCKELEIIDQKLDKVLTEEQVEQHMKDVQEEKEKTKILDWNTYFVAEIGRYMKPYEIEEFKKLSSEMNLFKYIDLVKARGEIKDGA